MTQAYIFDHVRTPRGKGKSDGALAEVTPTALAAQTLKALAQRNQLDTRQIEDVIMGCVVAVGEQGGNIARIATLAAGFDQSVPGVQINRYCASGLEAVNMAAAKVMAGQAGLAIAGGVESMSRIPMGSDGGSWAIDPAVAFHTRFVMQGVSADLMASKYGYSRHDLDAYAAASHHRAAQAWAEGRFKRSVVPVTDILGLPLLERDETIRPETSVDSLAALKPAFAQMGEQAGFDAVARQCYPEVEKISHLHHAGNSSGIVDGAAGILIGTLEAGRALGLTPRARFRSFASIGSEPTMMLTGPSFAAERALKNAGMSAADIDLWELNEAFSAVVLRFMEVMKVAHGNINVNGGAIAMGHPLGATGAMILGTLLDEMERRGDATGLATLCVGAGMGIATVIERV
ncbi:acetyl-CoA C-acetyltransferase [Craterilacuibacter sp.]|uniref:acetyl-CoA C-acetyltransferase n=1 Tax=Craterilacuibacter sp. TaxID=2870909 RepID=UPI003F2BAB63